MKTFSGSTETNDAPVVMIGFAEAMAAIETAWSLQQAGFAVIAFRRAGSRPALRRVAGVRVLEVPAPERDAHATVAAVRGLVAVLRPAALMPLDDYAVWVCSHVEGAPVAGPTGYSAECALDKSIQLRTATRAGLRVPKTQVLDDIRDAEPIDSPVMIKPARALYEVEGKLMRPTGIVCANQSEFQRALARRWVPPILIQPLIEGVGEGLFGHAGPAGVVGWTAHRRVRMVNPQGSASSACCSQELDPDLLGPSAQFLKDVGWRGMFMLEYLRDTSGSAWFMELNGRAWGSMALARRRGFEYPAWSVQQTLEPGFSPTTPVAPPEILCRNLGLELVHLLFVARGPRSESQTYWPRLDDAVRDVCRRGPHDRLYNWNPSQPRVLLADTARTLSESLAKVATRR